MKRKKLFWMVPVVLVAVFLLYDVELRFEFALPGSVTTRDPDVEAGYAACFAEKDDEIHDRAFGTIDNPDVQKEFITSNRAIARQECRNLHPAREVTTETPFRFNVVDLEPRFW